MSSEQVLLDAGGGVRVTTARANLGGRTYAMANVTSVNMGRTQANRSLGGWMLALALLVTIAAGGSGAWDGVLVGVVGVVIGFWLYQLPKDSFHVVLGSASGENEALTSKDQEFIQSVVDALNEAIVRRG